MGFKGKREVACHHISFMFFYPKLLYNFDMLRELQFMAKMSDDRQPSEHVKKLLAGGAEGISGNAAVLPALGSIPLSMLARKLVTSNKGYPEGSVPKTEEELQELVQKLEKGHNLDLRVRTMKSPAESEYRRSYPWSKQQWQELKLAPGSNPQTIAHEFGHAIQPHKLEKGLNISSLLARTPAAMALPSILALSGGLSDSEETPAYAKAAPYLGGAQLATILGEETRANVRALKLLKQKGIPLTTLQRLRQFVPSTSYLGRGALLIGAPLGILKGMDLYEKSRKTKHPFTIKQMAKATPSNLATLPSPEDIKKKWEERLNKKED